MNADRDAIALVQELAGLPLALSTAGAYLQHVSTSFSDYLRLHKASWLKLQKTSPQLSSYEDRSPYITWQISFDRIEQQNAASAQLLKWWVYFDRQDVWYELLRHANSMNDECLQKLTEDELDGLSSGYWQDNPGLRTQFRYASVSAQYCTFHQS